MDENPKYVKFLDKKGWIIRMFVDIFITNPYAVMILAEEMKKNAKKP